MTTVPTIGSVGYIADVQPQELPPGGWSAAQNMRFRDAWAETHSGDTQVFATPAATPYFLIPYRTTTSRYWVHCGIAKQYVDDGTTRTDITNATAPTGAVDDRWTGGVASGVLVVNNGVDQPMYWGGNTGVKFQTIPAWTSTWRAASVRPFKQYLVALDITKTATRYASMVKWSAAAAPGTLPASWDETDATKDAGEQDLAETSDYCLDQLALGDINVVYKERSMYGMQYIGAPFIWRFFRLPGDVGILARGCVVSTPNGHVVLTPGDVVIHNGQGPTSILEGRMRKWLFNSIDTTNFARSFLCVNQSRNEVWICFPESGQAACTLALTWNWQDNVFGVRTLTNATYGNSGTVIVPATGGTWATNALTWATSTTSWGNPGSGATFTNLLLSSTAPQISLTEVGGTINGANPVVKMERTGLTFDVPDVIKTIRSIVPRVDATAGTVISIQAGGAMDAESTPVWGTAFNYIVGTSRKADVFATGRYLSVRFSSASAQPWRMKSYDVDLVSHGRY